MKLLLDMNISPAVAALLAAADHEVLHWREAGHAQASDEDVLRFARENGFVLVSHDLDFGAILAASGGRSPSVVQLRVDDLSPDAIVPLLLLVIRAHEEHLRGGALVSVDRTGSRVRVLPLG